MSELEVKRSRIYELLDRHHLDALYLQRISSFAWITCGAPSYINTATSTGEASALITRTARYLITNNIEAPHYEIEEKLKEQGWDFQISPWFEPSPAFARLTKGLRVGADTCLPGVTDLSGEVTILRMFGKIQQAYATAGYPDEWRLHHQGGPAGYKPREFVATPATTAPVAIGQAYAWNPSITGTKVEETVLVTSDSFEVMTEMASWPVIEVGVGGKLVRRPLILEA